MAYGAAANANKQQICQTGDQKADRHVCQGKPTPCEVLFAGLMIHAPMTTEKAMSPGMVASQVPAAASAPTPAQLHDDSASAKVAIRDEVWRRRNWLRFAWTRNQN